MRPGDVDARAGGQAEGGGDADREQSAGGEDQATRGGGGGHASTSAARALRGVGPEAARRRPDGRSCLILEEGTAHRARDRPARIPTTDSPVTGDYLKELL
ncbi:hypothetical protein GCM10027515_11490 [Schumannella luteola]